MTVQQNTKRNSALVS